MANLSTQSTAPIPCHYADGEYACTLYWDNETGWRAEYPPKPERAPLERPDLSMVYFVGGDEGPIKIGAAVDPHARLDALRCGSPVPLTLHAVAGGGFKQERDYHKRFAAHRLHGEWFERSPEILAEIDRLTLNPGDHNV